MEGEAGDFTVALNRKPRYIREDKCTGCAVCVDYCPVKVPDPYNQDLSASKAIHIYFSQAVPLVTYIHEECLYLKEKKCAICEGVCQNEAIDLHQEPEKLELKVGAIVLAPGYEVFDPGVRGDFGYGRMDNVITSLDFERLLCATGPHEGRILRPSDGRPPRSIAWIQCVGSRQVVPGGNSYCSAVCCTYTQKQVILTKDHDAGTECTVFHNDIRAYGKDFEKFYHRTENLPGVAFIRSYVSVGREIPETGQVTIRYSTPTDGVKEKAFDLVVLSVGLNPPAQVAQLADLYGIELNRHNFCKTHPANPIETTRPGVFVSGAFQGPVDIPESVFSASGAGGQCGRLLDFRRGKLSRERVYPTEKDVSAAEPRVGVFVCHCGTNIAKVVDVPAVVAYARTLPHVVYATNQLFSCATDSAGSITETIREYDLNRVVVAACSPRTLEPLFRDTLREAGINQYFFDMANIREHCSWVHSREKEDATEKAKDITRMSVARSCHLTPLQEIDLPVNKAALVVGGGIAGMTSALSLADQGHDVYLLEKESELGGTARRIQSTLDGLDVQAYLNDLTGKVYRHPLVHVHLRTAIDEATGYVGNFSTRVTSDRGETTIDHGVTVIATGAAEYRPTEYLYGEDPRVLTQLELGERIARKDAALAEAQSLVMIQCVGCRQADRDYCARVCCGHAIKNALKLKQINPGMEIYILFRDIRTYGFSEDYYRKASDAHVKFIRYEAEAKPRVEPAEEEGRPVLRVTLPDYILDRELALDADCLVLSAAIVPGADNREIAKHFKVSMGPDGFFKEAHVKLRPVEFGTDGVYLCGLAHYPKHISETINQAYGAASRVITLLAHDRVTVSGAVCEVEERKCMACGACIDACVYGAIEFRKTKQGKKALVNPVLCKGDGLCNAKCPTGAIFLKHFTDADILSQIDAAVPGGENRAPSRTGGEGTA